MNKKAMPFPNFPNIPKEVIVQRHRRNRLLCLVSLSICLPFALVDKKQKGTQKKRKREMKRRTSEKNVHEGTGRQTDISPSPCSLFFRAENFSCKDGSTLYCKSKPAGVKVGDDPVRVHLATALITSSPLLFPSVTHLPVLPFRPLSCKAAENREAETNKRNGGEGRSKHGKGPGCLSDLSSVLMFLIRGCEAIIWSPRAKHLWWPKHIKKSKQRSRKSTEGSRRHGEERRAHFYLSVCHFSSPVLINVGPVVVPAMQVFMYVRVK